MKKQNLLFLINLFVILYKMKILKKYEAEEVTGDVTLQISAFLFCFSTCISEGKNLVASSLV